MQTSRHLREAPLMLQKRAEYISGRIITVSRSFIESMQLSVFAQLRRVPIRLD